MNFRPVNCEKRAYREYAIVCIVMITAPSSFRQTVWKPERFCLGHPDLQNYRVKRENMKSFENQQEIFMSTYPKKYPVRDCLI